MAKGFTKEMDELVAGIYDLKKLIANLAPTGGGGAIPPPPLPDSATEGSGIVTVPEAFFAICDPGCCGSGDPAPQSGDECGGCSCMRMVDSNGDGTSDLASYLDALSAWYEGLSGETGCDLDKTDAEQKCDDLLTMVARMKRWKERGGRK